MHLSGKMESLKYCIRAGVGACCMIFAACLPAYFCEVDKDAVLVSGMETTSPLKLATVYLDSSKISSAFVVASAAAEFDEVSKDIFQVLKDRPAWRASGGEEAFFEAFFSTVSNKASLIESASGLEDGKIFQPLYNILALGENRKKLENFLGQTQSAMVKKILSLKDLNTTLLPPSHSSAGVLLESAVLSCALAAQSGDFREKILREFSVVSELAFDDASYRENFETFALAVLFFEKKFDWTVFRTVFSKFDSMKSAYDFARVCDRAGEKCGIVVACLMMSGNADEICKYLTSSGEGFGEDFDSRLSDMTFAYLGGEGSLDFLLSAGTPIYKTPKIILKTDKFSAPVKMFFARTAAKSGGALFVLKMIFAVMGGALIFEGFWRVFGRTGGGAGLAMLRALLGGAVMATLFLFVVEPRMFELKFGQTPPSDIKFAFAKNIVNNLEKEIMNIQFDSATMIAVLTFLLMQFLVYVFCLMRLSYVKKLNSPVSVKFKLLENEDNLFDLNLYVGLSGTVLSLICLAMNIVSASLMAAYSSTLFGIVFTALFKIGHLRPYKRKLILEYERGKHS